METKEIVKEMIDLHKKSFDNFFLATTMIQDQAEKLLITFVHQMPGMNNGGGEVVDQWIGAYKKSRDDFKKAVYDGYARGESFFDYYNAMVMFQDQTKDMFKNWIPQDLTKNMDEMAAIYKNGYDEFKKYIDENIRRLQDFSPVANKTQKKT
jgi:hypothetical protein